MVINVNTVEKMKLVGLSQRQTELMPANIFSRGGVRSLWSMLPKLAPVERFLSHSGTTSPPSDFVVSSVFTGNTSKIWHPFTKQMGGVN